MRISPDFFSHKCGSRHEFRKQTIFEKIRLLKFCTKFRHIDFWGRLKVQKGERFWFFIYKEIILWYRLISDFSKNFRQFYIILFLFCYIDDCVIFIMQKVIKIFDIIPKGANFVGQGAICLEMSEKTTVNRETNLLSLNFRQPFKNLL